MIIMGKIINQKETFIYEFIDELVELIDRWDILLYRPHTYENVPGINRIIVDKIAGQYIAEMYRRDEKVLTEEISVNELVGLVILSMRKVKYVNAVKMIITQDTARNKSIPNWWYIEVDGEYESFYDDDVCDEKD